MQGYGVRLAEGFARQSANRPPVAGLHFRVHLHVHQIQLEACWIMEMQICGLWRCSVILKHDSCSVTASDLPKALQDRAPIGCQSPGFTSAYTCKYTNGRLNPAGLCRTRFGRCCGTACEGVPWPGSVIVETRQMQRDSIRLPKDLHDKAPIGGQSPGITSAYTCK